MTGAALVIALLMGGMVIAGGPDIGGDNREKSYKVADDLTYTKIKLGDIGVQYKRSVECGVEFNEATRFCRDGTWVEDSTLECPDGAEPQWPVARRERDDSGAWTRWVLVQWWSCPGGPGSNIELTIRDVERFPVGAPSVVVQPDGGRALINMPTIYYATDSDPRGFSARIIGQTVDLVIRPINYEWAFGDGTGWNGDDPGAPYPDYTVHRNFDQLGTFTTTLTTTWSAIYRVDGGAWQDVNGTVQTTSTAEPIETVERRTYLVSPE